MAFQRFSFSAVLVFVTYALGTPVAVRPRGDDREPYSAIIAFGDSFTDNGNGAWAITNHTWPANPNYFGGRFSNGPVWVEYVAGNLSIPLVDYAVGGATTSNTLVQGFTGPASTIPVPSVADQVASFLASPPPSAPLTNPLFVFLAGANDPLFNPNITAAQSFSALADARAQLAAAHPRAHVLALGYPDLSRLPVDFYMDPAGQHVLRVFTKELDVLWRAEVRAVSGRYLADGQAADGARLMYVDARPLFALFEYYGTPATYGFAPLGAYGSCLTGAYGETAEVTLCADAEEHVWWDEYHPSTHAHGWMARLVLDALGEGS